ncbi:glycosyltransferase [Phenylobacterium sp.]|jgi:cellulose synthase/poly-beta-1,6-N-acetylglucosamine synthase-like glycosyltransferase|uniref:glycosyltransferase n=1 Tax=Phenylobacterium sp. TaxID=1871053 RepID=UPI002E363BC6|nr:glycosyltransferase [Phenylobacterium sp.]HEX2559463.1 glycosyltransferase [Phenylobacterium sp.]
MDQAAVIAQQIATGIAAIVIGTGLLQSGVYLWQLILAARALSKSPPVGQPGTLWRRYAEAAPPITLMAPAYNEAMTIVESVRSLLSLQYPAFEVLVVNDGSKDDTLKVLIEAFELEPVQRHYHLTAPCKPIRGVYAGARQPRLVVVDKENGGKADALNAALNLARTPIVCSMDADSLLEPDALLRAVRPFVEDPERTVAVGGTVRIANGCKVMYGRVLEVGVPRNLLALMQTVEYLRAFLMARLAWSRIGALLVISGAFGLFRRQAVLDVGGYSLGTVGEDMELVVKLHKHYRRLGRPYSIGYVAEPVCWTEAPESLAVLGRQRSRWHRGALETFFKHRDMLFSPRYGRVGALGFGNILLVDVIGPVVEVLGYLLIPLFWAMGLLSLDYLLALLGLTFGFGVAVSVASLALEEAELRRFPRSRDLLILLGAAVLENFGYRQLNNFWRIRGLWQFLRKSESWGAMTRKGFARA